MSFLSTISEQTVLALRSAVAQSGDLEKYTALAVVAVVFVWIWGALTNSRIAHRAFSHLQLSAQFSAPGSPLSRESNSHYFVYSSGRTGCSGMMTSLHLAPRNDLIARFLVGWVWPAFYMPDRVEIELLDASIDPEVSGLICRKFEGKFFNEKFAQFAKLAKPNHGVLDGTSWAAAYSASSLTGFGFWGDAGGRAVVQQVLGRSTIAGSTLDMVRCVLISDKTVRVEISSIPQTPAAWEAVFSLTLNLLDALSTVRVSDSVRAEVLAQRSAEETKRKAASEAEAREAAAAKRAAEKRKEREDALNRMSPEAARKLEEKERKREQKKKASGGKVMVMKA